MLEVFASRRYHALLGGMIAWLVIQAGFCAFNGGSDPDAGLAVGRFQETAEPVVTVSFAGIEPKRVLRLQPQDGAKQDLSVRLAIDTKQTAAMETLADIGLEVVLAVRTKVSDVAADGSFTWQYRVRDVAVTRASSSGEAAPRGLQKALEGLKGMKGTSRVDALGNVLSSKQGGGKQGWRATIGLREGLHRLLSEPAMRLPVEPIGERAVWRVERSWIEDGIQNSTTERVEWVGGAVDRLEVRLRVSGSAPEQQLQIAGMPDGLQPELIAYERTGSGDWTVDLAGPLRIVGTSGATTKLSSQLSFQGLPLPAATVTRVEVEVGPAGAGR